jgi:hypothetical protein
LCADRYSAVLIAFTANVQHAAVIGSADVSDVGVDQFIGLQARQQSGADDRAVAFQASYLRRADDRWSTSRAVTSSVTVSAG